MQEKNDGARPLPAQIPQKTPKPIARAKNPFRAGFAPNGKRTEKGHRYITKRALLRYMLEVDLTTVDLPTKMMDTLRARVPGFFDNVHQKFTMMQILELVQIQLLFSKSGNVVQNAINAIKDRVEGKPVQKIVMDKLDEDPTEMKLSSGRIIHI